MSYGSQQHEAMLIKLNPDLISELTIRIKEDFDHAIGAHEARIERYREYMRRFYNLPDERKKVARVPLIQEQVLTKISKEYGAIFGAGSQIIADPRGDQDARLAHKVGTMMSYKFLHAMKPQRELVQFIFHRNLLGRAIATLEYGTKNYMTLDQTGKRVMEPYYKGPIMRCCAADEIVTAPTQNVRSIQEFPYVIYRQRISFPRLLQNIREGKFYKISSDHLQRLRDTADGTAENDAQYDTTQSVTAEAEGLLYGMSSGRSGRGRLQVWNYYASVDLGDGTEEEVVIRMEPETEIILSCHSLVEMYPKLVHRRPFVEGALLPLGGYWSMGLAQMFSMDEDELSANMNLFRHAGQMSVFPPIAVDPTSGTKADAINLEAGRAFDCNNANGIKQIEIRFDPNYTILNDQMTRAGMERRSGISDYTQGRDISRPTAPDTATGTIALMNAGNERIGFDVQMLDIDISEMIERIYLLETTMGDPEEWYRVTEEDSRDIVGAYGGKFQLTEYERHGMYDFKLRLASGFQEKAARRNMIITTYQLVMANPLVGTNPSALWNITAKLYRELLDENFAEIVPPPPDPGFSLPPKDEWTKMLQGEEVPVHPMDDDRQHLEQHMIDGAEHEQSPQADQKGLLLMKAHIMEHVKQQNQKRLMQAMVSSITKSLATNTPQTGGLTYQPPVSQNLADIGTQLAGLAAPAQQGTPSPQPNGGGSPQGAPPNGALPGGIPASDVLGGQQIPGMPQ
jgi:hypothetical protein